MKKYFSPKLLNSLRKGRTGRSSCTCQLGHKHDSALEARHCYIVHKMVGVTLVERQKQFNLVVNGTKICAHKPDFLVTYADGHQEVIESKGFPTSEWAMKRKMFEALYPAIKYNVWVK